MPGESFSHQFRPQNSQQVVNKFWIKVLMSKQLIQIFPATAVLSLFPFTTQTINHLSFTISRRCRSTDFRHFYISLLFLFLHNFLLFTFFMWQQKDCKKQSIKHGNVCHCRFFRSIIVVNFTFWSLYDWVISTFNDILTVEIP